MYVVPKTFGIKEFKKGYFPNPFNRTGNYNSPLPSKDNYYTIKMYKEGRTKILECYEGRHIEF